MPTDYAAGLRRVGTGKRHDPLYERLQGTLGSLEDRCTVLEEGIDALA